MAKISAFRVDSKAIEAGEWVNPGEEYDGLEIQLRGFTDTYHNAKNRRLRSAAKSLGGDTTKLPVEVSRKVMLDCIDEHLLLGVRGLLDDNDQPISRDAFAELLRDPSYSELVTATITAASLVGTTRADDVKDAAGNSAPLSE